MAGQTTTQLHNKTESRASRPVKTRTFRIVIVALPFMVPQLPTTAAAAADCGYTTVRLDDDHF